MKLSAGDFQRIYAEMSDEELLDIDRRELVEVARACYDEEVARRGLKSSGVAASPAAPAKQYVVAGRLDTAKETRRACEHLKAHYIPAHAGPDGLEVLVPAATLEEAREFLDTWISDEQVEEAVASATYVRHGMGTVRAYVYGGSALVEFVQEVFGAVELERYAIPRQGFHVEAAIGDSVIVMEVNDPPPAKAPAASIHVYVPDVDAAYGRALEMGAEEVAPPEDKPHDERSAVVRDDFGNTWWIATYDAP